MRLADRRHLLPGAAAFAAALLVALLGLTAGAQEPGRQVEAEPVSGTVELQLLGVNDFHGHLEPPELGAGGAAWLGAWLKRAAGSHPERTIRVHAGDMVGASPLISSHFNDEPTIEATNLMAFDVGTLGNHEFDEGGAEALRLVRRARYPYVTANTVTRQGGELILPPYRIIERSGVKVGFIGVTTKDTPYFLLSEFARRYHWLDLSDSVNRWVPELRSQGVEAIVVLAHAGALQEGSDASGEVVDETRQMDDAVDVVIAGHTHSRLDLEVDGKLVVQAFSYGLAFDQVRITVDRASGEVVRGSAEVVRTLHAGVRPDADLDALVKDAARRVAPLGDRVVGHARRDLDHEAVDRLAVDAQRAFAGADVALLHPGNTRADLERGPITYADAFDVQAYEHPLWRFRMSGEDLHEALAEQSGLLVSGSRELYPDLVYTVVANGVVAEGEPLRGGPTGSSSGRTSRPLWPGCSAMRSSPSAAPGSRAERPRTPQTRATAPHRR